MKESIEQAIQNSFQVKEKLLEPAFMVKIEQAASALVHCYQNKGKLLICGNGGSAADAQHVAAELVGRYEKERAALPAIALTANTSNLTCIGNDYSFEDIFSRQVEAQYQKGDVLMVISTSGNSPNVLKAALKGKELGAKVIALTGESGGKLKDLADIFINVPSDTTSRIQESHLLIEHILCAVIEKELFE